MKIKISSTKIFNSLKKFKIFKKKKKKKIINQNFQFLQKNPRSPKFSKKKVHQSKFSIPLQKKKKKKNNTKQKTKIQDFPKKKKKKNLH